MLPGTPVPIRGALFELIYVRGASNRLASQEIKIVLKTGMKILFTTWMTIDLYVPISLISYYFDIKPNLFSNYKPASRTLEAFKNLGNSNLLFCQVFSNLYTVFVIGQVSLNLLCNKAILLLVHIQPKIKGNH